MALDEPREGDEIIDFPGVRLVLRKSDILMVQGLTLDYDPSPFVNGYVLTGTSSCSLSAQKS